MNGFYVTEELGRVLLLLPNNQQNPPRCCSTSRRGQGQDVGPKYSAPEGARTHHPTASRQPETME